MKDEFLIDDLENLIAVLSDTLNDYKTIDEKLITKEYQNYLYNILVKSGLSLFLLADCSPEIIGLILGELKKEVNK